SATRDIVCAKRLGGLLICYSWKSAARRCFQPFFVWLTASRGRRSAALVGNSRRLPSRPDPIALRLFVSLGPSQKQTDSFFALRLHAFRCPKPMTTFPTRTSHMLSSDSAICVIRIVAKQLRLNLH